MHAAAGVEECASGRRGERRLAADESGPAARDAAEDADVGKKKKTSKEKKDETPTSAGTRTHDDAVLGTR